jgi:hypothetical protein
MDRNSRDNVVSWLTFGKILLKIRSAFGDDSFDFKRGDFSNCLFVLINNNDP